MRMVESQQMSALNFWAIRYWDYLSQKRSLRDIQIWMRANFHHSARALSVREHLPPSPESLNSVNIFASEKVKKRPADGIRTHFLPIR